MGFSTLIGLYEATFVCCIQDRFRHMLDDLNLATTVPELESFDSPLRDHLGDVWIMLHLDQAMVSKSLSRELLAAFTRFSNQHGCGEESQNAERSDRTRQTDPIPRDWRTFALDEHLVRRVRDLEIRFHHSLRHLDEEYAKIVGLTLDSLPTTPWYPSMILSALSVVLDRIDVPIHQKVRRILYGKFITDVLGHLGGACVAFLDALTESQGQYDPRGSVGVRALMRHLPGETWCKEKTMTEAAGNVSGVARPKRKGNAEDETSSSIDSEEPGGGEPQKSWPRRNIPALVSLLLSVLAAVVAWRVGTQLAEHHHGSVVKGEIQQRIESSGVRGKMISSENASSGSGQVIMPSEMASSQLAPEQPSSTMSDARAKSQVLRMIELTDFSWTLEPTDNTVLFDFSIRNGSERRISEVEVVCLQYSNDLELLEPLKAVLPGAIEPNMTRTFTRVPIGFANHQVGRVSCIIPDLRLD